MNEQFQALMEKADLMNAKAVAAADAGDDPQCRLFTLVAVNLAREAYAAIRYPH